MSDLEMMYPEGKTVVVQGESLVIKPYAFGQLAMVSKLARPVISAMVDNGVFESSGDTLALAGGIIRAMSEGGEDVLALVAYSIGKPREWLDTIQIDEGVELARSIFEVNADFFKKRILPILPRAAANPEPETAASAGDTSSQISLQTDTAVGTSTATP